MTRIATILIACAALALGCSGGSEEEVETTDETATTSTGGEMSVDQAEEIDEAAEPRPMDEADAHETMPP